ncbi:MAG: hypothetical protein ACK4Q4_00025 [Rhodocyclaceae bacterium]
MRGLRALLLGFMLVWAQCALAAHAIDHALHEHDEACLECLVMPGFAALPAMPPRLCAPLAAQSRTTRAVLPAPTFARAIPFHSRAPPSLQSA